VVRDVTKWYQSHGFNTKPRWAMLVEFEAKFSEKNCFRNGQNSSSEPMVSTLNLDQLCMSKWKLQSARRALREHLGGNGKLKRSSRVVTTMIVVYNHKIKFEP
jgi:hypothetical protein